VRHGTFWHIENLHSKEAVAKSFMQCDIKIMTLAKQLLNLANFLEALNKLC
jgi:hypothetical protein